jgi:cytochrome c
MQKAEAALPAPYNTADLANGEAKFAFCTACHSIAPGGPNMTGPNLHGVVGRKAGTAPDFNYSDAVKGAGFTWDAARLQTWLSGPAAMLPGTKMTFPGLHDPKDRTDVIAYLMVNSPARP